MGRMWDRDESPPAVSDRPKADSFRGWKRKHQELVADLECWNFQSGDPGMPQNAFLAQMQLLVQAKRTLTDNQVLAAGKALISWRQAISATTVVPDPDTCPSGYDPDVWDLALLFRQEAAREHIALAEYSNVLLYAKLERAVSPFRRRYDARLAAGKKPWTADGQTPATWQDIARAAITRRFATYVEDEHAADRFCEPEMFRQMTGEVIQNGFHRYILAEHAKRGPVERPVIPPRPRPSVLPVRPGPAYPDGSEATRVFLREEWLRIARRDFGRRKFAVGFPEAVRNTLNAWQFDQVADLLEED
jgi:hypothetical protein